MTGYRPRPPGARGPRHYSHVPPVRWVQVVWDWYLGPAAALVAFVLVWVGSIVALYATCPR